MTTIHTLRNDAGLAFELLSNGVVRRISAHGLALNLFLGNAVDAAPANLWLRVHRPEGVGLVPLLGPSSPSRFDPSDGHFSAQGEAHGLRWQLVLELAPDAVAWFWRVRLENLADDAQTADLVFVQDVALAPYAAVRLNEHYVSHYLDLTPLRHGTHGWTLAVRQNLAVDGRQPWALFGSLNHAVSFGTDALQVHGLAARAGSALPGLLDGLPGIRLQHEHALVALQDAPVTLKPGAHADLGFFACVEADHPAASAEPDLAFVEATRALCAPAGPAMASTASAAEPALFCAAPWLEVFELDEAGITAHFGTERRHAEHEGGQLLSFFSGAQQHVVLRAKELRVLRPHGHILRTGAALTPDESALTSTVWMAGVFHSMVTQGHVSINRFLSTVHSYLGLFRSHGQRLFVHLAGQWQQLGVPSAFAIEPDGCRWVYEHAGGSFTVHSLALHAPQALALSVQVTQGAPLRLLVTHHVALGGDDGSTAGPALWTVDADGVVVSPAPGSELARRFPEGSFLIAPAPGSSFGQIGGDEMLFADGRSRDEPFVCIEAMAAPSFGLQVRGRLVTQMPAPPAAALPTVQLCAPTASPYAADVARLADIVPWFSHNALVHYLAPRGLEQYSGGGWGTRDVCQGPLEMLLAFDRAAPVRDLLCRTFAAQNADGDWPQWFMFFERDRAIRASDSHGDIVFWPLLGLARYLVNSGDAALLDEPLPFHDDDDDAAPVSVWAHVERALALIAARCTAGTHLAAYWHGDWNDALQPADPALRERMSSAWTVTLHHQMLVTLAEALLGSGRAQEAQGLLAQAAQVQADFQRLLVVDGVVAGYALFAEDGGKPELLLHPRDTRTGLRYSLLPMMHAVLEDMLSPEQARAQMALIATHLTGPDGARLFDAPLAYRGGPQAIFQRAESSAFFGREVGVMYMHAHLRYAQALAHLGDAEGFFAALCRANPIGLKAWVPSAGLRQANCYFSSSDAAFDDRYAASRDYAQALAGQVRLDGGWRIYSSGPGIALNLVLRDFIGLGWEHRTVLIDPVLPASLDGLQVGLELDGRSFEIRYRVGSAGSGVLAVSLNGEPLAFTRRHNPYRCGAAAIERSVFEAACGPGLNQIAIDIG